VSIDIVYPLRKQSTKAVKIDNC